MSSYKPPLDDIRFALFDVLDSEATFARLGFAPQVTRRIAPTSLLMRRLRGMEASPLENLMINRRRSLRARGRRQESAYSG